MPERIQLRRTKGWRLPSNTVKVDRTTRWGNPYKIGDTFPTLGDRATVRDGAHAVRLFRVYVSVLEKGPEIREKLRGKNLACWCRAGQPCHADVLLEIANSEAQPDPTLSPPGSLKEKE